MKKHERIREKVTILPTSMYLSKMHDAGWTLVALEWEREIETSAPPETPEELLGSEEIPFGLRIAADCHHLARRPPRNANPQHSSPNADRPRRLLHQHGRRSQRPRRNAPATVAHGPPPPSSGSFPA